jgi:hypothetical protein
LPNFDKAALFLSSRTNLLATKRQAAAYGEMPGGALFMDAWSVGPGLRLAEGRPQSGRVTEGRAPRLHGRRNEAIWGALA